MCDRANGGIEEGLPVGTRIKRVLKLQRASDVGGRGKKCGLNATEAVSLEEGVLFVGIIGKEVNRPVEDFTNAGSEGDFVGGQVFESRGVTLPVRGSEVSIA